ncbi:MAG: hypothetical protein KDC44_09370, partial [Phaeodactylibacter sp.]|nr:hypothetical protein [Phaeodactylibacter sp.]
MRQYLLFAVVGLLSLFSACSLDHLPHHLDSKLEARLVSLSETGSLDYFILPDAANLAAIPQDPANPLTYEKVELGKLLFYETALARDAVYSEGRGTYSCATCHIPSAGFMPGRVQGIADGGFGFGFNGEERGQMNNYLENELDVQGERPLSLLNVDYVTNNTWSGKFGALHAKLGTEGIWRGH